MPHRDESRIRQLAGNRETAASLHADGDDTVDALLHPLVDWVSARLTGIPGIDTEKSLVVLISGRGGGGRGRRECEQRLVTLPL